MKTTTILPGLVLVTLLTGCANVAPLGSPENRLRKAGPSDEINWPTGYLPEDATFVVHNEIHIAAPPAAIWEVLVNAEAWPEWYDGASALQMRKPDSGPLGPGAEFEWRTMGFRFVSVIHEFEPPYRLGWESRRRGLKGYHAWLIVPTTAGSKVVTAETQYGLLANLQKIFQPRKLHGLHDDWLSQLKALAESSVED